MFNKILGVLSVLFILVVGNTVLNYYKSNTIFGRVSPYIYRILREDEKAGGTGFLVNATNTYLITNAHVCRLTNNNKMIAEHNGEKFEATIIKQDNNVDLCALFIRDKKEGLNISSSLTRGQDGYAIGHPLLEMTTPSQGNFLGEEDVTVMEGPDETTGKCREGTNEAQLPWGFFLIQICEVKIHLGKSNLVIYPGSSGSPVVNKDKEVVGVIAVSDSNTNYGSFVLLNDLRDFLEDL